MATNTIKLHRVLRASPDRIDKAWTTASAFNKWLPPNGYLGEVHEMDARVGGKYRMSFIDLGYRVYPLFWRGIPGTASG